jgi:GT2 family glycosyltransferase
MNTKPDLSIILVSYNTRRLTLKCIKSIYKFTKNIKFEIIVVDNASSDGSIESLNKLKKKYPLNLLPQDKNLGFGAANNLGASLAGGKYLLFLNTDTRLSSNALRIALEDAKKIKGLGAYSCKLLNKDGSIQATGGYFPTLARIFTWQLFIDDLPLIGRMFRSVHPPVSFYRQRRELDWITGAFMLIPRSVFQKVSGFDEKIFMYVEDTDLCYRLKKRGYKVIYSPRATVTHFGGASGGNALLAEARQTVYFMKKHYSLPTAIAAAILIRVGALLRLGLFAIIVPDETKSTAYRKILFAPPA